ncbi:MAG TPA: heme ABC exporter ATP-binding protein CcmA [Candidatus Nitrosopolaris sp.]|nr:heme ABC exporter ATP-binding protein CcmA [Candidatus Nitrosopolaris sp.]
MSAIIATSLTQRFGSEIALDAVELAVGTGEHLAVLGENGAGKTTLLRIIATAARPTSGTLVIFGLDAFGERRQLRARIGYVAHATGLYPALSAVENLEFFCTLQSVDRGRVDEVLDLVGLGDVARRPAGKLSRGEQQRLAIGRAVLHDPSLLVLDEPDASLDSGGADLLVRVMRDRTALIATHDHALANRLCPRTMELRHGRVAGVPTRLRVVH